MNPKCFLGVDKLLQGKKKEPARSPEAKIVILAESSSKIWGGLWAILTTARPSPLPPRTAFKASVLYVSDCLVPKGLATRRTRGSADTRWPAATAADPEKRTVA